MLVRLLIAATVVWPLVAGLAVSRRVTQPAAVETAGWVGAVYLLAAQVCHQRPERSFDTQGVTWPVCARCTGLYLAAPFAAVLAWGRRRRVRAGAQQQALRLLIFAAVPTVFTLLWEWGGLGMPPNLWRFSAALPLGAAVTVVLIHVASEVLPRNQSGTLAGHGSAT